MLGFEKRDGGRAELTEVHALKNWGFGKVHIPCKMPFNNAMLTECDQSRVPAGWSFYSELEVLLRQRCVFQERVPNFYSSTVYVLLEID